MDRTDVAILVNSTPTYYYILPLFFTMLRRYAPDLQWPIYLATEELDHEVIRLSSQDVPTAYAKLLEDGA
jgi:hypothetical protein